MIDAKFENGILEICINRPERKNAINHNMYGELTELFHEHGTSDACRAIILYGAGNGFTAGADLKDFQAKREPGDSPAVRFLRSLSGATQPIIAAVEEYAVGIGATMLQHCDFVYSTSHARFRLPFAALGLCPEGGSSLLLAQLVGRKKATDWLMTSRFFDGLEAFQSGFITELVEPGETLTKAREIALELSALPQRSIQLTKKMLGAWTQSDLHKAFDNEVAMFAECLASQDTQKSIESARKS